MKRRTFLARVHDAATLELIGERQTYAWNSAIRATEAIVRDYGRDGAGVFTGGSPVVTGKPAARGSAYSRSWTPAAGRVLIATVEEVID